MYSFILAPCKAVAMHWKKGKTNFGSMEYIHLFICRLHLYLPLNKGIFIIRVLFHFQATVQFVKLPVGLGLLFGVPSTDVESSSL